MYTTPKQIRNTMKTKCSVRRLRFVPAFVQQEVERAFQCLEAIITKANPRIPSIYYLSSLINDNPLMGDMMAKFDTVKGGMNVNHLSLRDTSSVAMEGMRARPLSASKSNEANPEVNGDEASEAIPANRLEQADLKNFIFDRGL